MNEYMVTWDTMLPRYTIGGIKIIGRELELNGVYATYIEFE